MRGRFDGVSSTDITNAGGALQAAILITHKDGTQTRYPISANTDAARGTALLSAVAASVPYDKISFGPGTFDLGSLTLTQVALTSIIGSGRDISIIGSTAVLGTSGCIFVPGSTNSFAASFTIQGTNSGTVTQGLYGSEYQTVGQQLFTGAILYDVHMIGDTDCIYVRNNVTSGVTETATLIDCQLDSKFDSTSVATLVTFTYINCIFNSIGPSSSLAGQGRAVSAIAGSIQNLIGCTLNVNAPASQSSAKGVSCTGGTVNLSSCNITTISNGTGPTYDLFQSGLGVINVDQSTAWNPSKVSGTINWITGPQTAYGTTTAALTASASAFGGTLTIGQTRQYLIRSAAVVNFAGASSTANQPITLVLHRTNNTPGDITNSSVSVNTGVLSTSNGGLGRVELPEVVVNATSGDTLQIYGSIAILPTAGSVTLSGLSIVAVPVQ